MPGPKHSIPRTPGNRKVAIGVKDSEGNQIMVARTPNKKVAKRLAARQALIPNSGKYRMGNGTEDFFRKPGSQNRKK